MLTPASSSKLAAYRGAKFRGTHLSMVQTLGDMYELYRRRLLDDKYLAKCRGLGLALRTLWSTCPDLIQDHTMFPAAYSYGHMLKCLDDFAPVREVPSRGGRRPRLTVPEHDWIALNPEGLTCEAMAVRLGRSPNTVFSLRQELRKQVGLVRRSPRGGGLFHLEPRWFPASDLPPQYPDRASAAARWNELYRDYPRDNGGAVAVSGPHQLMPAD
jgi:hypothetical protein